MFTGGKMSVTKSKSDIKLYMKLLYITFATQQVGLDK